MGKGCYIDFVKSWTPISHVVSPCPSLQTDGGGYYEVLTNALAGSVGIKEAMDKAIVEVLGAAEKGEVRVTDWQLEVLTPSSTEPPAAE